MKHLASKLMIAAVAVTLFSSLGVSSAQARTRDVVKYGAIGLGAAALSGYYNDGYGYSGGYYDSGYYGNSCGCNMHYRRAASCCESSCGESRCGLFGLGFLGL